MESHLRFTELAQVWQSVLSNNSDWFMPTTDDCLTLGDGLSGSAIAGIAAGIPCSILALILLMGLIFLIFCYHKKKSKLSYETFTILYQYSSVKFYFQMQSGYKLHTSISHKNGIFSLPLLQLNHLICLYIAN